MAGIEGLTILSSEQIDLDFAANVEKEAFQNKPPETVEGLRLLKTFGFLLGINEPHVKGITGLISLENLLKIDASELPSESPLRKIIENENNHKTLTSAAKDYGKKPHEVIYSHGIAVVPQGMGYGSALHQERIKRFVGDEDLLIAFALAIPPNISSVRIYLRHGAILDKIEEGVYEPGKSYFRMVHNAKTNYASNAPISIALKDDNIILIQRILSRGYVCTEFKQPYWLSFNRNS